MRPRHLRWFVPASTRSKPLAFGREEIAPGVLRAPLVREEWEIDRPRPAAQGAPRGRGPRATRIEAELLIAAEALANAGHGDVKTNPDCDACQIVWEHRHALGMSDESLIGGVA